MRNKAHLLIFTLFMLWGNQLFAQSNWVVKTSKTEKTAVAHLPRVTFDKYFSPYSNATAKLFVVCWKDQGKYSEGVQLRFTNLNLRNASRYSRNDFADIESSGIDVRESLRRLNYSGRHAVVMWIAWDIDYGNPDLDDLKLEVGTMGSDGTLIDFIDDGEVIDKITHSSYLILGIRYDDEVVVFNFNLSGSKESIAEMRAFCKKM